MSILAIAFPAEAAVPVAQAVVGAAASATRPLIGVGIFATLLMLFKPLLLGVLRAALLLVSPRKSLQQRNKEAGFKNVIKLQRLARVFVFCVLGLAVVLCAFVVRACALQLI